MKVAILGFTLPPSDMEEILRNDASMPIQTHTFAWALVDALRAAAVFVSLLSSAPAANYPVNPRVWFRGGAFVDDGIEGQLLGFVNILALKHLTRFVACVVRGTRALRRWRSDVLLIHGVHSAYLWYGVLIRATTRVRVVVVVTDPPAVALPSDGRFALMLKRIDRLLVGLALKLVDGVVVLTAPLAADFAPGVRSLVMEGICGDVVPATLMRTGDSAVRVMYAGGLSEPYGVDRLVSAFRRLRSEGIQLCIFGKGPLSDWINDQAALDRRIERVRFVDRRSVVEGYAIASLLVQPRPIGQDFVRYSFPSKLLEYMASGTPVLSTRLECIPAEYEPYLYWIDDDSVGGMTCSLREVLLIPAEERAAKGRSAAEFVRRTRSLEAQGARIRDFLSEIMG